MPYCPKCDMEFVQGVTVCTDCGGPLYESEEAYKAAKKESDEKQMAEEAAKMAALQAMMEEELANASEQGEETGKKPEEMAKKSYVHPGVYVDAAQKYEDMKSSASAFYLVGGLTAAGSVLCWLNVLPLPIVAKAALTLIAAGSLVVAVKTTHSAKAFLPEIAKEKERTQSIIQWFLDTYTGADLDNAIGTDAQSLSSEEVSLKRYELIQDYLITNHDLPDQTYVDALSEEIYGKLYD